jgi:hypothetical protein
MEAYGTVARELDTRSLIGLRGVSYVLFRRGMRAILRVVAPGGCLKMRVRRTCDIPPQYAFWRLSMFLAPRLWRLGDCQPSRQTPKDGVRGEMRSPTIGVPPPHLQGGTARSGHSWRLVDRGGLSVGVSAYRGGGPRRALVPHAP